MTPTIGRPAALLLTTLLVGIAAALVPSAARADYTVWSCSDALDQPVAASLWQATGASATDDCATGGGLTAGLAAGAHDDGTASDGWRLTLPADAVVTGARVWLRAATDATATGRLSAGLAPSASDPVAIGCTPDAAACDSPLAARDVTLADGATLIARCDGGACDGAASATITRSEVTLDDDDAPVVGTPADAGTVKGSITVAADAADTGAGVQDTQLVVDGQVVATSAPACAEPFTQAHPCPASVPASFTYDTGKLADGPHAFAIRATDGAQHTATGAARTLVVANAPATTGGTTGGGTGETQGGSAGTTSGGAATTTTATSAVLGESASSEPAFARIVLPPRRTMAKAVRGQVLGANGKGVAGLSILLTARPYGSTGPSFPIGRVTTDADGIFLVPVGGDSRVVTAAVETAGYKPATATLTLFAPLRATVRGPGRTLRNGDAFRLTGSITGLGELATGKSVAVQAIVGGAWRTVAKVRTKTGGRLVWTYRLRNSRGPADYRFRITVPFSKGQPWTTVSSRRVIVKVRPR